jgi:hypothetical protein
MSPDVRVLGKLDLRFFRMKQVVGVDAMDHVNVMPGITECVRQTVDVHCVSTETVRWVERGQMEEI